METVPPLLETLPLFFGFDEMSKDFFYLQSLAELSALILERPCCLMWVLAIFNAFVPAVVMVRLSCIMLVAGLVQEYGQDTVL
jgi:hypothetical protein